jgi:hypothetical protein
MRKGLVRVGLSKKIRKKGKKVRSSVKPQNVAGGDKMLGILDLAEEIILQALRQGQPELGRQLLIR